ncbi:MAG: alpha/beta fold hydrolase [Pseudomonadota bacterium]
MSRRASQWVASTLLATLLIEPALAAKDECVIVLHGLARTSSSMNTMASALEDAGYTVFNIDYPSREHTIEALAPMVIAEGLSLCEAADATQRTHFVAHSMGGILVRQYVAENTIDNIGRMVMLGPPNQGSVAADKLRGMPGFDWLNGPAGYQLGKGEDSVPLKLGPPGFEVGVIAGTRSIDPISSAVLPDPDDGKVSVADTKLEGMTDHIVVAHSHALMMRLAGPIKLTIRFLKTGSFSVTPE